MTGNTGEQWTRQTVSVCRRVMVLFKLTLRDREINAFAYLSSLLRSSRPLLHWFRVICGQRISRAPADERNEYFKIPIPLWLYLSLAVGLHIISRDLCCHRLSGYWPEGKPPISQIGACWESRRFYWTQLSQCVKRFKFSRWETVITQVDKAVHYRSSVVIRISTRFYSLVFLLTSASPYKQAIDQATSWHAVNESWRTFFLLTTITVNYLGPCCFYSTWPRNEYLVLRYTTARLRVLRVYRA